MVSTIIIWWVAVFAIFLVGLYFSMRGDRHHQYSKACPLPEVEEKDIVISGRMPDLSQQKLHEILTKRSPYYAALIPQLQSRFRKRLRAFMNSKTFVIKDEKGYYEMPVLVSAAAIQLTFGLNDFLLSFYRHIRIFPEAYFAHHSFSFLAGNVQGNTITVAWSVFLKGFENHKDGSNVGLHEMSHALYFQKIVIDQNFAPQFSKRFNDLIAHCRSAHKQEKDGRKDLYTDYGSTDLQEFWAESVELFFERPDDLFREYPGVFEAMTVLLNQDPRSHSTPLLKVSHALTETVVQLTTQLRQSSLNRSDSTVS